MTYQPQNANGQATKANSSPVVLPSDQTVAVEVTNNTSGADVITGDTGQDASVIAGARKEVTFSGTSTGALAATDVSNYRWVSVQVTSQGSGTTLAFQGSNDNTNWVTVVLGSATSLTTPTGTTTSTGIWHGPIAYRYFRVNVTAYTSGTVAGVIEFSSLASAANSIMSAIVSSNTAPLHTTTRGMNTTVTRVGTVNTGDVSLISANANRKEVIIVNESSSDLYVKFGSTATSIDYTVKLTPNEVLLEDVYLGTITGRLSSGSGNAQVTEVLP